MGVSWAQTGNVTLRIENGTYASVIKSIESQTKYTFLVNESELNTNETISIEAVDRPLKEVLEKLLAPKKLTYSVQDNHIVLAKASASRQARTLNVTGTVRSTDGAPLPGVAVQVSGTGTTTITDGTGAYRLSGVRENATLVFILLSMRTEEVRVAGRNVVDVTMENDATIIEEIVTIGYGSQKKSDVTGAISSVRSGDLNMVAVPSVAQMLAGKAAGVNIMQNSAQPGGGLTIQIRGATSTGAGNDPLFVVDGFPLGGGSPEPGNPTRYEYGSRNPLNSLNPYDIESIEILKDASATAIYGARAANGVVLITTKRGKVGAPTVTYNTNFSIQRISKRLEMLTGQEFMEETNRALYEEWLYTNRVAPYGNVDPTTLASQYVPKYSEAQIAHAGPGTDWMDLITRTGRIHQHNLSITGGTEYTRYAITGNFFDQKGVVKNSDLKRYSVRTNFEQKLSKIFTMGINMTLSMIENRNVALGDRQWENAGLLVTAISTPAIVPVWDANGDYALNPDYATSPNPVSLLEIDDRTTTKRFLGNAFLEANIIDGLKVRLNTGVDYQIGNRDSYLPKTTIYGAQVGGDASKSESNSFDKLLNLTVNYNKEIFENHRLDLLAGYEYQEFLSGGFSARSTGYFTDAFLYNSLGTGEVASPNYLNSSKYFDQLASYFARLNYSYADKYYLTLTGRVDGSTKFGAQNKYAFFPSAAISWRAIEEDFIKNLNVFSNLKLRVSYGNSGNSNIGQNSLAFYYSGSSGYVFGSNLHTGTALSQIGNDALRWETTTQFNVGLDMGFFKDRLSLSFEYYNKVVKDLLDFRALPSYSVVSSVPDNIGKTQSRGVELTLRSINFDGEFKWSTDLTLSHYNDRWLERNPNVILAPYEKREGPLRPIYGYVGDGLLAIGEAPPVWQPDLMPGQDKIKDTNGDNRITSEDQVLIGTYDPKIILGFGNTFRYKGFDLNIFFHGMLGRKMMNANWGTWGIYNLRSMYTGLNMMKEVKERWSHDNTDATMSSGMINVYEKPPLVEDGSFIRLKNITLGYTIPTNKVFNNLRVYVDLQNALVFTKYTGLDPETDSRAGYPNQRNLSFGLDLTF